MKDCDAQSQSCPSSSSRSYVGWSRSPRASAIRSCAEVAAPPDRERERGEHGTGLSILLGQNGGMSVPGGIDQIFRGTGDDAIFGEAGNDTIDAGNGNDFATGNVGTDTVSG